MAKKKILSICSLLFITTTFLSSHITAQTTIIYDIVINGGRVIDPDRVRAQFEGAAVFGAGIALMSEVTVSGGRPSQSESELRSRRYAWTVRGARWAARRARKPPT